jgi:energy-coupling factor transporter ATP-binding protein EcfA2
LEVVEGAMMLTETQANLLMIGMTILAFLLWWNAARIRKRIPWLTQGQSKPRNPGLFYYKEVPERKGELVHRDARGNASMHPANGGGASASIQPGASIHPRRAYAAEDLEFGASIQAELQSVRLSTIAAADNVLIVGPKGSGKTTILRTIVHLRASEACIALDPHAHPSKWPCTTVGHGRNYPAIDAALRKLNAVMDARFKQLGSGAVQEGKHPRRSLVGDEFRSLAIALNGKDGTVSAGTMIAARITEGRKVRECALIASHNDTLEALGLPAGASALKACFDYVVYLGGLAVDRAPASLKAAVQRMEHPAIAYLSDKNQWFVLQVDVPLVTTVSSLLSNQEGGSQGGIGELVPVEGMVSAGIRPDTTWGTSSQELDTTSDTTLDTEDDEDNALQIDGLDEEVIRVLKAAGWTGNDIAKRMRGKRQNKLARIRQATGEAVEA